MRRGRDKECSYCGVLFFNSLGLGFMTQSGENQGVARAESDSPKQGTTISPRTVSSLIWGGCV